LSKKTSALDGKNKEKEVRNNNNTNIDVKKNKRTSSLEIIEEEEINDHKNDDAETTYRGEPEGGEQTYEGEDYEIHLFNNNNKEAASIQQQANDKPKNSTEEIIDNNKSDGVSKIKHKKKVQYFKYKYPSYHDYALDYLRKKQEESVKSDSQTTTTINTTDTRKNIDDTTTTDTNTTTTTSTTTETAAMPKPTTDDSNSKSTKAREIVLNEFKNGTISKLFKCPFCTSIAVEDYCTTLYCPGPRRVGTMNKFSEPHCHQDTIMKFINKISKEFSMQCNKRYGPSNKTRCGKNIHLKRDHKHGPFLVMDCSKHRDGCPFSNKPADDARMELKSQTSSEAAQPINLTEIQDSTTNENLPRTFIIGYSQHVPKLPNSITIFLPRNLPWNQETEDMVHDGLTKFIGNINSGNFETSPPKDSPVY